MRAVKGNKVYSISENENEKEHYRAAGYDILDDSGKTVAYGRGKTVPYEEYQALKLENEELARKLEAKENEETVEAEAPKSAKTTRKAGE